jgi:hypothetical protein
MLHKIVVSLCGIRTVLSYPRGRFSASKINEQLSNCNGYRRKRFAIFEIDKRRLRIKSLASRPGACMVERLLDNKIEPANLFG